MLKVVEINDKLIMIFDDGKIFITDKKLSNLSDNIDEKSFVDCSSILTIDGQSADYIH